MATVYCIDTKTFKLVTEVDMYPHPIGTLIGKAIYTADTDFKNLRVNANPVKTAIKRRTFIVVGHLQLAYTVHLAFVEEAVDRPAISTGDSLCVCVTDTNGETTTLGPYQIPHDTECFLPNSSGHELGEDLMHILSRQDPLPIVNITIKKADKMATDALEEK